MLYFSGDKALPEDLTHKRNGCIHGLKWVPATDRSDVPVVFFATWRRFGFCC
jgi:hypothetical protein